MGNSLKLLIKEVITIYFLKSFPVSGRIPEVDS